METNLPPTTAGKRSVPKGYRLLKVHEMPKSGDFYHDERGLEPWEGPSGFKAGAFLKPIYRPDKIPTPGEKELDA
jgi:hypothetical protein